MLTLLTALILTAGGAQSSSPPGQMTQGNVDELLAVVLDRVLTVEDYLPDRTTLPKDGPIPVDEKVYGMTEFVVTDRALKAPRRWLIRSEEQLRAQADSTGKVVHFVVISGIHITGASATLIVGVTLFAPRPESGTVVVLCCCFGHDRYERDAAGLWRFEKRESTSCA